MQEEARRQALEETREEMRMAHMASTADGGGDSSGGGGGGGGDTAASVGKDMEGTGTGGGAATDRPRRRKKRWRKKGRVVRAGGRNETIGSGSRAAIHLEASMKGLQIEEVYYVGGDEEDGGEVKEEKEKGGKMESNEEAEEEEECGVCLLGLNAEGTVKEALLCYHVFHEQCLDLWWGNCLKKNIEPSCPMCRARAVRSAV